MASWRLSVWKPASGLKSPPIAVYTDSDPGGIVDGFRWSMRPDGDSGQLVFHAVPRLVDIPIGAVLRLEIDTGAGFVPVWYGYVRRGWSDPTDGQVREYVCMGASDLLRRVYTNLRITSPTDTGAIVRQLLLYRHPAILWDTTRIPDSGVVVSDFAAAPADLASAMNELAKRTPGVRWGVDVHARLYFEPVQTVGMVRYEDGEIQSVPAETENIVDRVRLVWPNGADWVYEVWPPKYGYERAYVAPPEAATRLDLTPYLRYSQDGDLYVKTSPSGGWTHVDSSQFLAHSYYLWDDNTGTGLGVSTREASLGYATPTGVHTLWIRLVARSDAPYHIRGLPSEPVITVPGGVTTDATYIVNQVMRVLSIGLQPSWSGMIEVYELQVWTVSEYGAALAKSLVRLPSNDPAEVIVSGYVPPTTMLVLVGGPGGDITLEATEYEYEYTAQSGLITRIYSGVRKADMDPVASAIQAAVIRINERLQREAP